MIYEEKLTKKVPFSDMLLGQIILQRAMAHVIQAGASIVPTNQFLLWRDPAYQQAASMLQVLYHQIDLDRKRLQSEPKRRRA